MKLQYFLADRHDRLTQPARIAAFLGFLAVLTLGLLVGWLASRRERSHIYPDDECYAIVQPDAAVQLDALEPLSGREGSPYTSISQNLGSPYCILPKVALREGTITERLVYLTPENARLIVAYEDDEYLGYTLEDISFPGHWWESGGKPRQQRAIEQVELKTTWGVRAGDEIGRFPVVSGLGDISIRFEGEVLAPFDGLVREQFVLISDGVLTRNAPDCVLFVSPQTPAYIAKICGLDRRFPGHVEQGDAIGHTDGYVHIALFSFRRDDSEGLSWVYVSPSAEFLSRLVPSR